MTPARLAHIAKTALAVHRGRTVPPIREGGPFDGRARIEHAQADPPEYPVLVFSDPPDDRDVPDEEYPPEPDPFDRDEFWWRRK